MGIDRLGDSDELADTVNYAEVAGMVAEVVAGAPHNLIETVASLIADGVLRYPMVQTVGVTVHKPQAPIQVTVADVSVTINRSRNVQRTL